MSPSLPPRPSLEWLRKTAKDRLDELRLADPEATLATAQLLVARDQGFSSWRALKAHVDRLRRDAGSEIPLPILQSFFGHVGAGRFDHVSLMIAAIPQLVNTVGPHPFWGGRPQALHVAIETGRREMIDLLLDAGADVNGANAEYGHWSPLMIAADKPEIRAELLRRGARVGLLEALRLADDGRVEELLADGLLPAIQPNGGSILAFARTTFAIDRLLALGAAPDTPDRWGSTPIDAMSRLGPRGAPLVRHMIAHRIAAAPEEYARLGDLATLERLIAADPAIVLRDAVMMAAVDGRHHDLVHWLLAHGASANARSTAPSRQTALHSAAWNGDLRMVQQLTAAGADRHARDEQYDGTPLDWARTSITVTNNRQCEAVADYLQRLDDSAGASG